MTANNESKAASRDIVLYYIKTELVSRYFVSLSDLTSEFYSKRTLSKMQRKLSIQIFNLDASLAKCARVQKKRKKNKNGRLTTRERGEINNSFDSVLYALDLAHKRLKFTRKCVEKQK